MTHMLLAGIAMNAFAWALIGALQFAADDVQLRDLSHWMLGQVGVDLDRMRRSMVVWVALAVGVAVACTGPIGFVGLAVPHILRLMVGSGHRTLLLDSALLGASLLLGADALARVIVAPAELPVGILTTLLGAPLFVALLLRDLRGRA